MVNDPSSLLTSWLLTTSLNRLRFVAFLPFFLLDVYLARPCNSGRRGGFSLRFFCLSFGGRSNWSFVSFRRRRQRYLFQLGFSSVCRSCVLISSFVFGSRCQFRSLGGQLPLTLP